MYGQPNGSKCLSYHSFPNTQVPKILPVFWELVFMSWYKTVACKLYPFHANFIKSARLIILMLYINHFYFLIDKF